MSGGFFRGTSADQDTRFSNKQSKLLKSQKFAPELEHLVDMTKVKMDIMKPWIANRVTELIGFEDEVLINFIYGLLDGKEVNGKEVQISLTGFMERNTGKFMKELWLLLLSAQKNASGVPQQFLDAKEEETKKKKAESERIANEIQRRKEKESRELEQERTKKMDHGNDILKDVDSVEPSSKHQRGGSVSRSIEEKGSEDRNGSRGRSRGLRSRSISKSFSNSRSYSDERRRSRSVSNKQRGRSSSSDRVQRISPRHPLSPHGRHSPRRSFSPRRRSSYSRRRSSSRSHRRSPSPTRFRMSRRSRSPLRRRSRSPTWRRPRSPTWRSSPRNRPQSAIRRRSPSLQRRSPSPIRRKSPSPSRYRPLSPLRRKYRGSPSPRRRSPPPNFRRSRSPVRRRSRSPVRRRSRSPIRRASPSPVWRKSVSPSRSRSPRRSPRPANHKSPSPREYSSASPVRRKSLSPVGRKSPKRLRRSPLQSPRGRKRSLEKLSPVHHAVKRNAVECTTDARQRSNSLEHKSDSWDRNDSYRKLKRLSPSPHRSSSVSEAERETGLNEKKSGKIHHSYSPNPPRKAKEKKLHDDSSETGADDREICIGETAKMRYNSSTKISSPDQPDRSHIERHSEDVSPKRVGVQHPVQTQSRPDTTELNKKDQVLLRGDKSEKMDRNKKHGQQDSQKTRDTLLSEKRKESPVRASHRSGEKNLSHSGDTKMNDQKLENLPKLLRKVEQNDQSPPVGSDSDESDKDKAKVKNKRKNKRQELESDDESSYDSYAEERKEAKKRRKEEKKMRKEEKRRRRGERRRRKEERRAEKQKLKSVGSVSTPSDTDRKHDDQGVRRQVFRNDMEESLNEQKKLEIELREKAIELYMAKKSTGN